MSDGTQEFDDEPPLTLALLVKYVMTALGFRSLCHIVTIAPARFCHDRFACNIGA